jgi:hypothetical protein
MFSYAMKKDTFYHRTTIRGMKDEEVQLRSGDLHKDKSKGQHRGSSVLMELLECRDHRGDRRGRRSNDDLGPP